MRIHGWWAAAGALFIGKTCASRGDQLDIFHECVAAGLQNRCEPDGVLRAGGQKLPWSLRLTRWTCAEDVDYECQRHVTDILVREGYELEQFHGKWPFTRVLGVQEPLSMLFSVLNGLTHWQGLGRVKRNLRTETDPMYTYYLGLAVLGLNAWLWSTVFHTRDNRVTERLDYFSAGAYVLYGLYYAPVRVFELYKLSSYRTLARIWGLLLFALFLAHCSYLSFWRFDYAYNMTANVVAGALHGVCWLVYTGKYASSRPKWAWIPAGAVVALAVAMSLELFDFYGPHWIDAHALWHASTIPITVWWYSFLIRDSLHERQVTGGKMSRKAGNLD
ncbi:hypothetical protein PYCC9005_000807 [Savitreella phatthalungensis]